MFTRYQIKELNQALLSAYPKEATLRRMVRFELDERLRQIAGGENQREIIFNLIEWAESEGRLEELIKKACADNPGNPQLSSFARQVLPSLSSAPQTALLCPVPPVAPHLFGRERFLNQVVKELVGQASGEDTMAYRIALRGMAGVGKTALAKRVANDQQVVQAFPDGRAWLSLGHQPDIFLLLGQLLQQFGSSSDHLRDIPARADHLRSVLAGKTFLLLLDDVWQSAHAHPFLEACHAPACLLLTTRDREVVTDLHCHNHDVWVLKPDAAVQMLADAGANAADAVAAAPEEAKKLVDKLGYLPLALHVAGRQLARLARADGASHAVTLLQAEIEQRLLTWRSAEGRQGIPDTEPSLEAIIALSYDALPNDATRQAFCRLAVFGAQPLDFDAHAMASVWQTDSENAFELRATLIDYALLEIASQTPRRYTLHQIIHYFAQAQLKQDNEQNEITSLAHAQHYATRAQQLNDTQITDDPAEELHLYEFLSQMDQEFPQIRRAIEWAHTQNSTEAAQSLRDLIIPLGSYSFTVRTFYDEYGTWLTQTLDACQRLGDRKGQAEVLFKQGYVLALQERRDEARKRYEQALSLFRAVGHRFGEANMLAALSRLLIENDSTQSQALLEQALALHQEINYVSGMATALGNYAFELVRLEQQEEALPYLEQARDLFASHGLQIKKNHIDLYMKLFYEIKPLFRKLTQSIAVADQAGLANTPPQLMVQMPSLASEVILSPLKAMIKIPIEHFKAIDIYLSITKASNKAKLTNAQLQLMAQMAKRDPKATQSLLSSIAQLPPSALTLINELAQRLEAGDEAALINAQPQLISHMGTFDPEVMLSMLPPEMVKALDQAVESHDLAVIQATLKQLKAFLPQNMVNFLIELVTNILNDKKLHADEAD